MTGVGLKAGKRQGRQGRQGGQGRQGENGFTPLGISGKDRRRICKYLY